MISQLFTYDRSAAYRNVDAMRDGFVSQFMTQGGVTMYRFFRDIAHAIVLTGSVRTTFRTLSDDDLFYSRLWGVCRGECVYGWFMESEGNFYVRLLYSKWVGKSWNTFECWIRMTSSFTLDVSFYVEYLILRLLRSL